MLWKRARRSDNVVSGGSGGGRGGKGLTLGAVVLVVAFGLITGQDPLQILGQLAGQLETPTTSSQRTPVANDEQTDFVRAILGDTEDTWRQLFQQAGRQYQDPTLVLFNASSVASSGRVSPRPDSCRSSSCLVWGRYSIVRSSRPACSNACIQLS